MSQIRISRSALDEVEQALEAYKEFLAKEHLEGVIKENTRWTYDQYANDFVRWLRGEFEPGARNRQ